MRPHRSNRFDSIGQANYSGFESNLLTGQFFRIATTIKMLMVLENNLCHGPGEIHMSKIFIACLRMSFY